MMETLRKVALWVEDRLHLVKLWEQTAGHPVPKSTGSWFYTFGSMTMLCLIIQILTGIFLAMVYVPSAAEAYHSLERLNYEQQLGWVVRGMHYWGSTCMVILMILHMTQVFLWGAYKDDLAFGMCIALYYSGSRLLRPSYALRYRCVLGSGDRCSDNGASPIHW